MQKLNLSDLQKVAKVSYYKKSQLARMNKASLYELLEKHNRNICSIEHITKLDMIDCLLEIDNKDLLVAYLDKNLNTTI